MDLSMKWLKEFVDIGEMPMRSFTEAITMSGSKVEGWETEGSEIDNVVDSSSCFTGTPPRLRSSLDLPG